MHLTPHPKLNLKWLTPHQQTPIKPRLNTQIQPAPLGHNIKRPNQLRRQCQEPILRKYVPRTLSPPAAERVRDLAALGLALRGGERSAVRVGEVAVGVEGVGGGVERRVVRVNPYVLQNGCAFGEEVATEGVIRVEGMWEVDGGYGAPAEDLMILAVVYGSVCGVAHFEETGLQVR